MNLTLQTASRSSTHAAFNSLEEMQVFYYQTEMEDGRSGYFFFLAPEAMKEELDLAMQNNDIPSSVVVLAAGEGQPDEKTWFNMERYFGYRTVPHTLAA